MSPQISHLGLHSANILMLHLHIRLFYIYVNFIVVAVSCDDLRHLPNAPLSSSFSLGPKSLAKHSSTSSSVMHSPVSQIRTILNCIVKYSIVKNRIFVKTLTPGVPRVCRSSIRSCFSRMGRPVPSLLPRS